MPPARLFCRYDLFFVLLLLFPFLSQSGERSSPVLVNSAWLVERIDDNDLVILNVAQSKRDYLRGHIPGARFLWPGWVAASNPDLSTELLPLEHLDTLFEGLGISNHSRIVLYGVGGNVNSVGRVFATLEHLGMGDLTSVLDGGLEAWKREGHPLTTEMLLYPRGMFTPRPELRSIVDIDYVRARIDSLGFVLIDARSPQTFSGKSPVHPRSGHIPGARNISSTTLVDSTNMFLPLDSLKTKFEAAGVQPGDQVITYCQVGQSASSVFLAARALGYAAHLYDGSFEDWGSRDDLPVEIDTTSTTMPKK